MLTADGGCDFEAIIASLTSPNDTDCGHFHLGQADYTADALAHGENCVLAARDAGLGYVLELDQALDGGGWAPKAFVQQAGAVDAFLVQPSSIPSSDGGQVPFILERDCIDVGTRPGCSTAVGTTCLTCSGGDFIVHVRCTPP